MGSLTRERAFAVANHCHVSFFQPTLEGDDIVVPPNVGNNRLARINRCRETRVEAGDHGIVVVAKCFEDSQAGGAIGTQPVQDRYREADTLG